MTYKEFNVLKDAFFKKHKHDFQIETSDMDEYGRYLKEYYFADGSVWYESYSPIWEDVVLTGSVHGVEVKKTEKVKFFITEAWSTDNADSVYLYEKW